MCERMRLVCYTSLFTLETGKILRHLYIVPGTLYIVHGTLYIVYDFINAWAMTDALFPSPKSFRIGAVGKGV